MGRNGRAPCRGAPCRDNGYQSDAPETRGRGRGGYAGRRLEEKLADVMHRLGMREGFDIGLEMSGSPQAFESMVDHIVMGGHIAMLGIPARPAPVDWTRIVFKLLTIKGIYGREMFETWHKMIAMLQSGLDVRKVITHRIAARDFQQGFDIMRSGKSGKIVLDWR